MATQQQQHKTQQLQQQRQQPRHNQRAHVGGVACNPMDREVAPAAHQHPPAVAATTAAGAAGVAAGGASAQRGGRVPPPPRRQRPPPRDDEVIMLDLDSSDIDSDVQDLLMFGSSPHAQPTAAAAAAAAAQEQHEPRRRRRPQHGKQPVLLPSARGGRRGRQLLARRQPHMRRSRCSPSSSCVARGRCQPAAWTTTWSWSPSRRPHGRRQQQRRRLAQMRPAMAAVLQLLQQQLVLAQPARMPSGGTGPLTARLACL
jgi:hypothetical protein